MSRDENQNCAARVLKTKLNFYDSAEVYNLHDGNKNNLRTSEAQVVRKLKNNEARFL